VSAVHSGGFLKHRSGTCRCAEDSALHSGTSTRILLLRHSSTASRSVNGSVWLPGLLFKCRTENNAMCVGLGHSNLPRVPTRMEKALHEAMRALTFCASEPTKAERPGFISNSTPIQISGCRQ